MSNKSPINQLSTMLLITIITQIFLLIKNSLIAARFGIGTELDAFNFTTNISTFIYSFIGAGISTILIPRLRDKNYKYSVDVFITVIYTIGFLLLVFMLFFREQVVILLSGSSDLKFINIASNIFIFTLLSGFLNSFIGLVRGVLEYHGQFNRQKLIVLLTTILTVLILWRESEFSIYFYAKVILITTILSITIHFLFLKRSGFKYNINLNTNNSGFKEMMRLFFPVILSTGVYQLSLLIDTMIAARLDVGSISILSYANAVISMINMLILANLISYFYPRLIKNNSEISRQKSLSDYILFINVILCFIVTLFLSVGKEGISILYERGNFTKEDTNLVFICSLLYALSLPTNGIRDLIYKYFYINKDTTSPFLNSILISILNLSISIILAYFIGLNGVVLGTVIASFLSLYLIILKFKKKFPIRFNTKHIYIENTKVIIVTLLTVLIIVNLKTRFIIENTLFEIFIYSTLTLVIFVGLLLVNRSNVFKIKL